MTLAEQSAGACMLSFLPEQGRSTMAAEISWSLSETLKVWSSFTNADGWGVGATLKQLHKLQTEVQNLLTDVHTDLIEADGHAAHRAVEGRRDLIQESLAGFGT